MVQGTDFTWRVASGRWIIRDSLCTTSNPGPENQTGDASIERRPELSAKKKKAVKAKSTENNVDKKETVSDLAGPGNVEKIREIIFGSQMRDYERQFKRLENRILKEVTSLREETLKRFEALETYLNKEVESINDALKTEGSDRKITVKELAGQFNKFSKATEKKTAKLENQIVEKTRDLRQQLLDQSKSLTNDIRNKYIETTEALDIAAEELRGQKVDRSTMAELLTEIALRLSNDSALSLDLDPESLEIE